MRVRFGELGGELLKRGERDPCITIFTHRIEGLGRG